MNNSFKEAPDHITVKLEFIYYIYYQYIEKQDIAFIHQKDEFVKSRLTVHCAQDVQPCVRQVL